MTAPTEREINVFMAKVAEQAERFDEMVIYLKKITKLHVQLTLEERNLLSVAYKNLIGARRASWRLVASIEHKESEGGNDVYLKELKTYNAKIEEELTATCADVMKVLDEDVIPFVVDNKEECNVFYYKMKADYYRYLSEFPHDAAREKNIAEAKKLYEQATDFAKGLPPTSPICLGLALNFSVFYYEILHDAEKACEIAKSAFDTSIAALEELESDNGFRDSTMIMQLIRDNLTLWRNQDDTEA